MRDTAKRNRVLTYYQNKPNSIIYMQETFTIAGDMENWKKIWKGQIFLSHGNVQSKGVAILIHENVSAEIERVVTDPHGRYVLVEGKIAHNDLALCNYYAPTRDKSKDQLEMLDILQEVISNVHHKLVFGGDMNVWLQPHLDKYGNSEMTKAARKMNSILENLNLIDIWRTLNPETKRYTWRSKGKKGITVQVGLFFCVH
jgi:exonuclease III